MPSPGYDIEFVPNDIEIDLIRFDWEHMVGKDLERRMRTLTWRAQMSAGVRTGRLNRSISTFERNRITEGLEGRVGSTTIRYAAAHHEGARPHLILPKKKNGLLVFTIAGTIVFARRVNHPGNRPNPFLARWLQEAVI